MTAIVYLLHFTQRYPTGHRPQHYLGVAADLPKRLREHRAGNPGKGGALPRAMAQAGISFELVASWEFKEPWQAFAHERALKRAHHHARLCPRCNPKGATP